MDYCVDLLIIMMLNHNKVGYTVYKNQMSPEYERLICLRICLIAG